MQRGSALVTVGAKESCFVSPFKINIFNSIGVYGLECAWLNAKGVGTDVFLLDVN